MHNRQFSFEIQNELTNGALYKQRIVNSFPCKSDMLSKLDLLTKPGELWAAMVTMNTLK